MTAVTASFASAIPTAMTPLIGRQREIAAITALLLEDHQRLVTLTGPGGTGKTRLAMQVAADLAEAYRNRVWFVSLAPVRTPALVVPAIAEALGVRQTGARSIEEQLLVALQDRSLLVLDNLEHLPGSALDIATLLAACSELSALVTSRVPLRLTGEQQYTVAPLELPASSQRQSPAVLARTASVALFCQRARAVRPDFVLTDVNAAAVAEICTRLDGLPLALELAAARMKALSPQALLARLSARLLVLTGGPRDAPARHQTLRDTIRWSYDLLAVSEQRLLRQISVFVGGWTLEAAEAVVDPDLDIFDGLAALVDHSLVQHVEQPDGSTRYVMLETIREFGLERLDDAGEQAATRQRHATWVLDLVERAAPELSGPRLPEWLTRLDAEGGNLRAALTDTLARGDGMTALRIAIAASGYWTSRGRRPEGRQWMEQALAVGGDAPATVQATALTELGGFANASHDYATASWALEQALVLHRETGNRAGLIDALYHLGDTFLYQGNYRQAGETWERAVNIARKHGDRRLMARCLAARSLIVTLDAQYDLAWTLAEESLALFREIDDRDGVSMALGFSGYIALWSSDLERAEAFGEECRAAAQQGGGDSVGFADELLAWVALERGDFGRAGELFRASLTFNVLQDEGLMIAECLEGLSGVAGGLGDAARGATLLGAAEIVREQYDTPIPPPRRDRYDRSLALVRAGLSDETFAESWATGRRMSLDTALRYALEPDAVRVTSAGSATASGLSKREIEVLRFVVDGLSDRQIADQLFLSHRTVMRHVSNILNKLGVTSRTAAATVAVREGLI